MSSTLETTQPAAGASEDRWSLLPPYVRSLLKIEVTLSVKLAAKELPLQEILDLAPGALLQFPQRFDAPVTLMIGEDQIAEGDVVKVDDCFGIRVTSVILPTERFTVVRKLEEHRAAAG